MAVSPNVKSIVFAMGQGGLKRLDVDTRSKVPRFTEVTGSLEERLRSIGTDVKALAFHPGGELLAVGGEDGSLAVYEWPGMKPRVELSGDRKLPAAVKDLDWVPYGGEGGGRRAGRALVAVLDDGSVEAVDVDAKGAQLCRVAPARGQLKNDKVLLITSGDRLLLAHLPPGMEGSQFSRVRCRTVPPPPEGERRAAGALPAGPLLTLLLNNRSGSHLATWVLGEDGMLSMVASCKVAAAPGACMDVSGDGSLAAVGTSEGDVMLVGLRPHMRLVKRFPKAHMVFTTCIAFNADGSHVLSASADASATLHATALPPPTDIKRLLVLAWFALILLALVALQVVRVLKQSGWSNEEILALVGLRRGREEL